MISQILVDTSTFLQLSTIINLTEYVTKCQIAKVLMSFNKYIEELLSKFLRANIFLQSTTEKSNFNSLQLKTIENIFSDKSIDKVDSEMYHKFIPLICGHLKLLLLHDRKFDRVDAINNAVILYHIEVAGFLSFDINSSPVTTKILDESNGKKKSLEDSTQRNKFDFYF